MHRLCTTMAIAFAVAAAPLVSADAGKRDKRSSDRPVIIQDRSLARPPPPLNPPRNYYGPPPSLQPPMERVPLPKPLAQPPTR